MSGECDPTAGQRNPSDPLETLTTLHTTAIAAPWAWQMFGGQWYLVGAHGPRPVVLSAGLYNRYGPAYDESRDGFSARLETRCPTTRVLIPAAPDNPSMSLIPALRNHLPDLLRELAELRRYKQAMEQMAAQFVHPRTTAAEMCEQILKGA